MGRLLAVCLMLIITWGRVGASDGMANEYGHFVVPNTSSVYTVAFLLDGTKRQKFEKVREVMMTDQDFDGQGDVAEIWYQNGGHVAHLRSEKAYRYYVTHVIRADVCTNAWSTKVSYRVTKGWSCSQANLFEQAVLYYLLWSEVDAGLQDAQRGDWLALTERLQEAKIYMQ